MTYFVTIGLLYLWMRGRDSPFKLAGVMRVYNLVCTILAGIVVVVVLQHPPVRSC